MLALASGIAPSVWESEGSRTINTALALLRKDSPARQDQMGRQLSG